GSAADYIGGAWSMYYTASNIGATGIFKGDKGSIAPSTHWGYYTGMLEHSSFTRTYATTYISQTLTDFDASTVKVAEAGRDVSTYYIKLNGSTSPRTLDEWARIQEVTVTWSGSEGISQTETSHSEYMEWGYWTQTTAMPANDEHSYYFANRGYYVWGDNTAPGNMPGTGSYTYEGPAYGTFWTSAGGNNMSGTFDSTVNFATAAINDFNMTVSGSSYSASISGASGSISDSKFSLSGGTWQLGPTDYETSANSYSGHGSFYGPNAAAMGGVWQMGYGGCDYHAAGSFVSTSKTTQSLD
ncbi:MAG: hypothetical protein JXB42_01885, partial [Deltaproteobacteria bacterium]|nr:hypothetical protein [Deltaproteobacteria bacterium]